MIDNSKDYPKSVVRRAERLIEIARALKGEKQTGRYFHCTFILKKRKIISIGINDYIRVHPEWKYGPYYPSRASDTSIYHPGIHSEIDAIERLNTDTDTSSLEFWNIHICNNGDIGCSKPCFNCSRVLNELGYKRLYYFDESGDLQQMP